MSNLKIELLDWKQIVYVFLNKWLTPPLGGAFTQTFFYNFYKSHSTWIISKIRAFLGALMF